ncbi:reverse transcriptase domain-containing protein [Tanacetum coccineum]
MSSPNHPTSDIEDAFSSNFLDYIPASPDYFLASPGNTSSKSLNNSFGLVPIASPTLSLFHNDPYMKVMQAYDAISPPQVTIPPPTVVPPSPVLSLPPMFDSRDFFPPEEIPPPKDTETPVESPIPISPSSSVGSSSPVRSTTPPPDYPFDESIFAELDNSLWIIPRPLGSEPVPEESNKLHGFLEVTAAQVRNRSRIGINKWYQSLALRNFDLEDMELESKNSGPTANLPIAQIGGLPKKTNKASLEATYEKISVQQGLQGGCLSDDDLLWCEEGQYSEQVERCAEMGHIGSMHGDMVYDRARDARASWVAATLVFNTASPQVAIAMSMIILSINDLNGNSLSKCEKQRMYYQKTGKKIFSLIVIEYSGYDKSKVDVYNCHKLGHFARDSKQQEAWKDQFRNNNTRKPGNKQDTSKAMLAIDGYTDKTCSKTCLNNYESLKKQYDDLLAKQLQTKFESATYKRGLDTVEAQLVIYRKNEENSDKSLVKELESQVKSSFVKGCGCNTSKRVSEVEPKKVRENNDAPIIEDWVSDDEEQDESITKPEKKTVTPTAAKIEKPVRKSVREKGIKREYSLARTPQKNGVAERKNMTLIEDARTMADLMGKVMKVSLFGYSLSSKAFSCRVHHYTASPNEEDSTEEEPEVDLENITNSYIFPTTPNTRINKDHPIDNVIGDVQSTVQTRRMLKPTSEQGFLSDVEAMQEDLLVIQTSTSLDIGFHSQEEGIDYEEVLALCGKLEANKIVSGLCFFYGFPGITNEDKYVAEILRRFNYSDLRSLLQAPFIWKNLDSMFAIINSGMARFQVTPKTSHLLAVKRNFRYLKGKPTLGLWYFRDSLFELVAYTESDYAGATLDRKSTTGGYLLTKGFDAGRFQYLVSSIGMLNP